MKLLPLLLLLLLQAAPRTTSAPHQATLNWQNSSCTTGKPCSIQIYRATCSSTSTCPTYPNSAYATPPTATLAVTISATATGTSWQAVDADPALADGTTYAWVSTNTYSSNPSQPSAPSAIWIGTTPLPPPPIPNAPTVGGGNSIQ